jgi:hypothetical protein
VEIAEAAQVPLGRVQLDFEAIQRTARERAAHDAKQFGPFKSEEERKLAFASCLNRLCHAKDAGRIGFEDETDENMFIGLLATALVQVLGRPPETVKMTRQ